LGPHLVYLLELMLLVITCSLISLNSTLLIGIFMGFVLIALTVLGVFLFNPIKSGLIFFLGFCLWFLALLGWLIFSGNDILFGLLLKFLFLGSGGIMVFYRLRWSDFKFSDLLSIKSCFGGVPLKGGRVQRNIMDALFYFFIFMCLVVAIVRFLYPEAKGL